MGGGINSLACAQRIRLYTTLLKQIEIDVRSEDLPEAELSLLTEAIRNAVVDQICRNQIDHSAIVQVPIADTSGFSEPSIN